MNDLTTKQPEPTDIAKGADVSFAASVNHFEAMAKMAEVLANSSLLPESLIKEKGGKLLPAETRRANAFLICNQARQWDCDPMSLAQGTSLVYGRLMFEGKIVAGIVNARAGLVAPLDYEFSGTGDNRTCRVFGTLARDPETVRSVEVVLHKVRTKTEAWATDPDQMLTYRGARQWARRHTPSILMGVAEDYVEVRDAAAKQYEKPDEPLDPILIEDGHRKEITNAINADRVDLAAHRVDRDAEELGEVRTERLKGYAEQRRAEITPTESSAKFAEFVGRLAACDFHDQKAVAVLAADIATAVDAGMFTEDDIAELRQRYKLEVEAAEALEI